MSMYIYTHRFARARTRTHTHTHTHTFVLEREREKGRERERESARKFFIDEGNVRNAINLNTWPEHGTRARRHPFKHATRTNKTETSGCT